MSATTHNKLGFETSTFRVLDVLNKSKFLVKNQTQEFKLAKNRYISRTVHFQVRSSVCWLELTEMHAAYFSIFNIETIFIFIFEYYYYDNAVSDIRMLSSFLNRNILPVARHLWSLLLSPVISGYHHQTLLFIAVAISCCILSLSSVAAVDVAHCCYSIYTTHCHCRLLLYDFTVADR